jgi:release factor glutamine methyltransferase
MTAGETLNEGREFLRNAGIESYGIDAALLLGRVLDADRARLLTNAENQITGGDYEAYRKLLRRRANHECAAYITNSRGFRFLDLYVDKNVLVPRPETEILVEAALTMIDEFKAAKTEIRVLDMCTGSGAVALALKHERRFIEAYASDISEAALAVARKNAEKYQLEIRFIQSDVFENVSGRFGIITANAPYIPGGMINTLQEEARNEPRIALDGGTDGLEIINRIIEGAGKHLEPGGGLLLEAAPEQMAKIKRSLVSCDFAGVEIKRDLSGAERTIGGRLKLGPKK